MDDAKKQAQELATQAKEQTEAGLSFAAQALSTTLATTQELLQQAHTVSVQVLDDVQVYVDAGKETLQTAEDHAVRSVKDAVTYTRENPYVAYPSLATAALLILPGTRLLLWRATFGRFVSPESVINSSGSKINSLKQQGLTHGEQIEHLEQRLVRAEEEYLKGYQMLRNTRQQLQRLAGSVGKDEHAARAVVAQLRRYPKQESSLALRGEAAVQAATFAAQGLRIKKGILRIAQRDI